MNLAEGSWQLDFLESPLYHVLSHFNISHFSEWPSHTQLNQSARQWCSHLCNAKGKEITFVPQDKRGRISADEQYEPRIYLKAEVQTRQRNWHDYFNACCWCLYPKSKALLNALQYQDILNHGIGNRSRQQNVLTQFDECGVVIVCQQPALITLLRQHQWQALLWQRRDAVLQHMQCYVFGHALFEKAMKPYLGLTAKAIILDMPKLALPQLDAIIADYFRQKKWQANEKPLQPFPLLGYPGWHPEQSLNFYQNTTYFRGS